MPAISFFERLASSETFSSAARKNKGKQSREIATAASQSKKNRPSQSVSAKTATAVFRRLRTGTYSSIKRDNDSTPRARNTNRKPTRNFSRVDSKPAKAVSGSSISSKSSRPLTHESPIDRRPISTSTRRPNKLSKQYNTFVSSRSNPKNRRSYMFRSGRSTTSLKKSSSESSDDRRRRRPSRGSSKKSNTKSSGDRSQPKSTQSKKSSSSNKPDRKGIARMKSIGSISTKSTNAAPIIKLEPMPEKLLIEKMERKMSPRRSIEIKLKHGRRRSTILTTSLLGLIGLDPNAFLLDDEDLSVDDGNVEIEEDLDPYFNSCYAPNEMRCMALVAHNHMKSPMINFVLANKNLLKKFKLTGTHTTMAMLREIFGNDPDVVYGPACSPGTLGGDAELVAIMCTGNLGGCVYFQDPMSTHPHAADIECLTRQANVHNILMMTNPSTAYTCMATLRVALEKGKAELIPYFFETLRSPSVEEYNNSQARVLASNVEGEVEDDFS